LSEPNDIANSLNNYFCNIGSNLAANLPSRPIGSNAKSSSAMIVPLQNTFVFADITISEVEDTIKNLNNRKSSGVDDIHAKFVTCFYKLLAPVLTQLFNTSVNRGEFPKDMKIAKIIPIPKTKTNLNITSNYRPIALLSIFSKIFEKIMTKKLTAFFTKYNVFYEHQYGFRSHYSTKLALIESVNEIRKNLDDGKIVAGIYLDLAKAFDSLSHDILLSKLYKYGIRGFVLNWIKSYISSRVQITYTNGVSSLPNTTNYGVPQGSVLGPLLFLIYINDMGFIPDLLAHPKLFADDANVFVSGTNFEDLRINCLKTISSLYDWITENRLTLNIDKTCYMIFLPNSKHVIQDNFSITINSHILTRVAHTKFLGVVIDDKLTWKNHIEDITLYLRKQVGIFYKISNYLPIPVLKLLYFALIHSKIIYAIELYANTFTTYLHDLIILNNRLLKISQKAKRSTHTDELYLNFNTLIIPQLFKLRILLFIHAIINKSSLLPPMFYNCLTYNQQIHHYGTRQSLDPHRVTYSTNSGARNIYNIGTILWSSLPSEIKSIHSIANFKKRVSIFLRNEHN